MRSAAIIRAGLVAGVSFAALAAVPAMSQAAKTGAAATDSNGIEEIVVTAQRTAQSLQDVPIAVSAFTAQALEKQQINNASDLQLTLPNITFTKSNFTGGIFTIRGVGDLCVGVTCDAATAIHINDLPLFGTRIFETEYMDLERVEVLRGPQGTLFGRNATAGVVNFITAKPDLKALHAAVEGEYGNYNSYRVKGMINIPLTDTLGVRFAGYYLKRDGFTKDLFTNTKIDGRDQYAIRGSLRWKPDDRTTVDLMGYYFREKDNRLRNQKQLCQRDASGVLGCTPGALNAENTNFNSTFAGVLSSKQLLAGKTAAFGPAGSGVFQALALGNLYGPDALSTSVNPSDPRQVNTNYQPRYFADEVQASIKIEHDFGAIKAQVSGLYQRDSVDSSQDYNNAVINPAAYAQALGTASAFAAGAGGPAFAQIGTAIKALIPNGPAGPYCTSSPYDTTGTGVYGGHSICGSTPLNYDRSDNKNDAYTGEAIIQSQFDGKFNFLLGGIYNRIHLTENSYYVNQFGGDYTAAVLGLATTLGAQAANPATPNSYLASPYYRNNTNNYVLESYGLFGEAYFKATDKLKITLGLRYNDDKKNVSARTTLLTDASFPTAASVLVPYTATNITQALGYAGLDFDPGRAGAQEYDVRKAKYSELTGRAVIDWKITDNNLLYFSYSRGYKSGGVNPPLSPIFAVNETFTPEFIDAFEVGSKNTFLDGTLRLNLTGFYYKYKSLQISRIVARTSVNDNVDAEIYGLEADAIIQPVRALAINLGFSYLNTKVTSDKFLANPRDPSGGRGDAVIIKDISNASNCAVVPNTAGAQGVASGFVGFANTLINGGALAASGFGAGAGLKAPVPFADNSGLAAGTTGAFSICAGLSGLATATGAPVTVLNEGVAINIRGNNLPQSPSYKASAGIQYTVDFANGMNFVPRFDIAMTGTSYGSIFNGSGPGQTAFVNRIPSYYIMNAQVQLNGRDDRWFIRGYIQNIQNNSAVTGQYVTDQSSGLFTNIFTLEPRRYGVAAGIKF